MRNLRTWIFLVVLGGVCLGASAQSACPPLTVRNGYASLYLWGKGAMFACQDHHTLVGETSAYCLDDGTWSEKIPVCVGHACPKLDAVPGVTMTELYNGGILHFACSDNMVRVGPHQLICDGTSWNEEPPKCLRPEEISSPPAKTTPTTTTSTTTTTTPPPATTTTTKSSPPTTTPKPTSPTTTTSTAATTTTPKKTTTTTTATTRSTRAPPQRQTTMASLAARRQLTTSIAPPPATTGTPRTPAPAPRPASTPARSEFATGQAGRLLPMNFMSTLMIMLTGVCSVPLYSGHDIVSPVVSSLLKILVVAALSLSLVQNGLTSALCTKS